MLRILKKYLDIVLENGYNCFYWYVGLGKFEYWL